jgi:branched-chain amino acid transport system ATP-binding protein
MTTATDTVLAGQGITKRFGGLVALNDVTLDVPKGTIVGLVGPNGAGKSTLFGCLSGLLRPEEGSVFFNGEEVTGLKPQKRARLGMARTFQQPELFLGLTVREHIVLAHRVRFERSRLWSDMVGPRSLAKPPASETEAVDRIIDLLEIQAIAETPVAALPLGSTRLVEVARALATDPDIVLLDEPLSGLDLRESEQLAGAFTKVVKESSKGLSLLLVEHDVATVLALSSKIFVLEFGQLIASGTPDEIRNSEAVRAAYLGDEDPTSKGGN